MPAKWWVPGPEWEGRTAVVVATGPSLTLRQVRSVTLARIADRCRVIAVNDAALVCWFADVAFAADGKWWEARNGLPGFRGRKVQLDPAVPPPRDDMLLLRRAAAHGYDGRLGYVCTHRNSGAMAAQIPSMLGASPIVLVGFDMRETVDGDRHWFGHYEGRLKSTPDINKWVRDFRALHSALGAQLINATPNSALEEFMPYTDLDDVLGAA